MRCSRWVCLSCSLSCGPFPELKFLRYYQTGTLQISLVPIIQMDKRGSEGGWSLRPQTVPPSRVQLGIHQPRCQSTIQPLPGTSGCFSFRLGVSLSGLHLDPFGSASLMKALGSSLPLPLLPSPPPCYSGWGLHGAPFSRGADTDFLFKCLSHSAFSLQPSPNPLHQSILYVETLSC